MVYLTLGAFIVAGVLLGHFWARLGRDELWMRGGIGTPLVMMIAAAPIAVKCWFILHANDSNVVLEAHAAHRSASSALHCQPGRLRAGLYAAPSQRRRSLSLFHSRWALSTTWNYSISRGKRNLSTVPNSPQ